MKKEMGVASRVYDRELEERMRQGMKVRKKGRAIQEWGREQEGRMR